MDILGLTNTEQIRAVLTTSESNLPDSVIEGFGLEDDLGRMLDSSLPTWPDLVTANVPRQVRALRLVAKYFCAGTLARTATLWVLKKETDGSNEGQRSDKEGYTYLAGVFFAQAEEALNSLLEDLELPIPEVPIFTMISRGIPDRDPITEARETATT